MLTTYTYLKKIIEILKIPNHEDLNKAVEAIDPIAARKILDDLISKNKNVIIFDDILTTGATANECARILKENGAKKILVLTIAKD